MKRKLILITSILFLTSFAFAQEQETVYYDENWMLCPPDQAEFYRIINYDATGKPVGPINDYYVTGELQSTIERVIYTYKDNDANLIYVGKITTYYKSGKKQFEQLNDSTGKMMWIKSWYENGNIVDDAIFVNGKINGKYTAYHEDGTLAMRTVYKDGKIIEQWSIVCDENGYCQKIFSERFDKPDNPNAWPLLNKRKHKSEIIVNAGLRVQARSKKGFKQLINLPVEQNSRFGINCSVQFIAGSEEKKSGLIWDYIDENNYRFYYISTDGHFSIGSMKSGKITNSKNGFTKALQTNSESNLISIFKSQNSVIYYINGNSIGHDEFYGMKGESIGFYVDGGQTLLFQSLSISVDFELEN